MIAPSRGLGACGLQVSRGLLSHLAGLGNRAASKRLAELNQMCAHLGETLQGNQGYNDSSQSSLLSQKFSFERGCEADLINAEGQVSDAGRRASLLEDARNDNDNSQIQANDGHMSTREPALNNGALGISLDEDDGVFWAFQPGTYTGAELADWEMFESQISVADLS